MITDGEINARLAEAAGFTPADGWAHVRRQLRLGMVFVVRHLPGTGAGKARPNCHCFFPAKPFLAPCPFCGTTEKGFVDNLGQTVCIHLKNCPNEDFAVCCDYCGIVGPEDPDKIMAVHAWNKRSQKGENHGN